MIHPPDTWVLRHPVRLAEFSVNSFYSALHVINNIAPPPPFTQSRQVLKKVCCQSHQCNIWAIRVKRKDWGYSELFPWYCLKLGILKPSQRKQYILKEQLNCYVSFAQVPKYLWEMLDGKSWGRQKRKQRQQKGFLPLYCIFYGDCPSPIECLICIFNGVLIVHIF